MSTLLTLLAQRHVVTGMVHVRALPGTPAATLSVAEITACATDEARRLCAAGCDALIVENMHDRPYLRQVVGPEVIAVMTAVAGAVVDTVDVPVGIQILAGANRAALAAAQASRAAFVRAEGFVYAHVADEGLMPEAAAGPLLRYRRQIGADHIAIFADIKKKHASHSLTADIDIAETARAAEFCGADGIIVTGAATGAPAAPADVKNAARAVQIPTAVGSGLTPDNLAEVWSSARMLIVGSYVKVDGLWSHPIDDVRLTAFMDTVDRLRAAEE